MEKSFTLKDLYQYAEEINQRIMERRIEKVNINSGPSELAIKNILGYSSALRVLKTASAGNVNLLVN